MEVKIIEATQDKGLYGKFLIGRFVEEWRRPALVTGVHSLLRQEGWTGQHILVQDLSRPGNGSIFRPGGYARADLEKRQLQV